jgi:hypothetical protein
MATSLYRYSRFGKYYTFLYSLTAVCPMLLTLEFFLTSPSFSIRPLSLRRSSIIVIVTIPASSYNNHVSTYRGLIAFPSLRYSNAMIHVLVNPFAGIVLKVIDSPRRPQLDIRNASDRSRTQYQSSLHILSHTFTTSRISFILSLVLTRR